MIVGFGSDMVDIRRIHAALERFGEHFERKLFTQAERDFAREKCRTPQRLSAHYAKRFAAKEACAKALGTGFRAGISWQQIEIITDALGAPTLRLSGAAQARLADLAPAGTQTALWLSLSDEPPLALAQVIIWAQP